MSAHVLTGCILLFAAPQDGSQPPSKLEEVMANVRAQPLGSGTVDDLALPEDLLRRLSDRILRRSFEDHFRIVVAASAPGTGGATTDEQPGTAATISTSSSPFRAVLNVLALVALCVLTVLGYFAWRARSRRKE